MKRYDVVCDGGFATAPVESREGEWVRFTDLIPLLTSVGSLAVERDAFEAEAVKYRKALSEVAGVPLTLPSAALAVDRAREVLDGPA